MIDILPTESEPIKLINDDCLNVLKNISDNSVDLILTDPPYNISGKGHLTKKGNNIVKADFGEWDYSFNPNDYVKDMFRILKDGGSFYTFTSDELFGKWVEALDNNGFKRMKWMVWRKTNPVPSFRKVTYLTAGELIIFVIKPNDKIRHTFNFKTQKEMHNIIDSPICQTSGLKEKRFNHPTQKPIKIIKHLIEISSNEEDIVLDPFLGSGTTAVACKQLKRKCLGIEISKEYCDISKKRLAQEIL